MINPMNISAFIVFNLSTACLGADTLMGIATSLLK
jgi:hypothetical protein